ncbi:L-rhamnose isomerase [Botrimarina hoheduenensis]|uniref:L-rhamnose isomerase n=1 Tax=Botrimarina hoheduenensis TaxID=2528000 RepID=A0A5C5VW29_9BACT|nr:L-rhamnose isomerase [Botrimarina hoheduenensis]
MLDYARERYAARGVDLDAAVAAMDAFPVSIHCWQGDDVSGFESDGGELGGGLAVTGNYPGRARNADELRSDLEAALRVIPGQHRLNLHAIYAETGTKPVGRDRLSAEHFSRWIDWACSQRIGLDFNPSYFAHPLAASGMTLAHADTSVRRFWIDHGIVCRRIAAAMGAATGTPCITNVWVPDGMKDTPVDRKGPRERLADSLDAIFAETLDPAHQLDAVECKLFGIGAESYTVGSHEFYLGYAASRGKLLCLDTGHFHPTEVVSDKLSAVLQWIPEVLLHVSRGVRWDSDHVVTLSDELRAIACELVRGGYGERVHIGLDFFDATIHRVAAWAIGVRATQKALLAALLEPITELRNAESTGDYTARLALLEDHKTLPLGVAWDHYCELKGVPRDGDWLVEVQRYEHEVTSQRD